MVKNKVACTLSAAALLLGSGFVAPMAWADGESCEASNFEELEACLANEAFDTITTTDIITLSGEDNDKILVVDKTINGVAGKNVFEIENGASLTLRGGGTINAGRYGAVVDGAELIIDGVTISAINSASYGVYAKYNGRVSMESGTVVADYAAFAGNNTTGDMNFYIHGGILRSLRYPAIYMPGQVDLEMRGGTLDGGIVARMGQIRIEGGTINAEENPVDGDGIQQNPSSMPSVADEAITLLAGTYKSDNEEHGNNMNVIISGDNTQINGDVVLYDFGRTADGYAQNVNIKIEGGRLTGFKTKFTEEEIGFPLWSGCVAGGNAGTINIEITGGSYTTAPDPEDIAEDSEVEEEGGVYVIYPKEVDWGDPEGDNYISDNAGEDGHVPVAVEFGEEFFADRKATLSAVVVESDEFILDETKGGELIGAIDINMLNRYGEEIVVEDNDLTIYVEIDEEMYDQLAEYDRIEAVYFDEDGEEAERVEAELKMEEDGYVDPETGEIETWAYCWIEFNTTHLSTYGIVGVNDASGAEDAGEEAGTPDTGTMTVMGASAMSASLIAAIVTGVLVAIVAFVKLSKISKR